MHFLDLTLPTIGENLALDEALLLQAEAGGGEALRSWEWEQTCVVLGAGGHKLSGSAQQRKRSYLLHHGTLLYDFDTSPLGRYLRMPARQPEYRHQREHSDFLMNLPTRRDDLIERLRWAWGANIELTAWPQERVRQLVEEKYSRPEWIRRR